MLEEEEVKAKGKYRVTIPERLRSELRKDDRRILFKREKGRIQVRGE